jgi:transcriptional regulator with XRE-family HTH domain
LKPLDYPREFSLEARDRIEREKIRASRELLPTGPYAFEDQELAVRCIMRIFLAFAKEACALRTEHGWTLDRVQREADEFLRRLTITVVFAKFPGLEGYWINNLNGSILSDVEHRFKVSPEWAQYEELLLADIGTKATPSTSDAKTRSTGFMPGQFEGIPEWQVRELMKRRLEAAGRTRADEKQTPESPDPMLEAFGRNDTTVTSERTPAENNRKTAQVVQDESIADGAKVRIARNIEKLKTECGWSYEQLADATGIDKKLVLSHTHRKHKPNPKTLRDYAQAFSKELNRSITANNLEE